MRALCVRAAARGRGWHVAIANNRHNEQSSNLEHISAGFEPGTSRMRSVFLPSELCKKTPQWEPVWRLVSQFGKSLFVDLGGGHPRRIQAKGLFKSNLVEARR